jgi:hypothetical protein
MNINDSLITKSSVHFPITTITGSYTVSINDYCIIINNGIIAVTITLPAASGNIGRVLIFKRANSTSTGTITLGTAGGNIESGATFTFATTAPIALTAATRRYIYMSDGTNWHCIN